MELRQLATQLHEAFYPVAIAAFHHTPVSAEGRACGVDLLNLTGAYEEFVVPKKLAATSGLGILALIARGRHLLKVAYHLADRGEALGAAMLMRGITESLFTLAWLDHDPELGHKVWLLDEIRTRLSVHKAVAADQRRERRRAQRRGESVPPIPPGRSLGPLDRADVRRFKRQREVVRGKLRALPRLERRLRGLKVDKIDRMPSFEKRAAVADLTGIYAVVYRADSNIVAHPNPVALEMFIEEIENEKVVVRGTPRLPSGDPYVVGALLFGALLHVAVVSDNPYLDHSAFKQGVEDVRQRLIGLQLQWSSGLPTATARFKR